LHAGFLILPKVNNTSFVAFEEECDELIPWSEKGTSEEEINAAKPTKW
jgi:hypothetical protein